jgi:hypothetical protein
LSSIKRPIELSTGYGKTAALYGLKMQRLQPFPGSVSPDYGFFMQWPEGSRQIRAMKSVHIFVIAKSVSDKAIQISLCDFWIASLRSQ